jgi:aryl-alcohol dehydrogenase-like predicted oxidoreductase
MTFGTAWDPHFGGLDRDAAFDVLDAYFAAGGNFLDCASSYTDEQSETIVGEWLHARGVRDRMVVATKYTLDYKFYAHGKNQVVNYGGNSKLSMHLSLRDSLKKLQTDWVDIFYVHAWDYTCDIADLMDALHLLVQQGKVLYLGISNTPAWVVSAGNAYAKAHGKTPFSVYQGQYNLTQRDLENDVMPMSRAMGLGITAFGVLASGKLKSRAAIEERKGTGQDIFRLLQSQSEEEKSACKALETVAEELGAKVETVAIAWIMSKFPHVFPTLGIRKPEHLKDAMSAVSLRLSPEHIALLEASCTLAKPYPHGLIGADISETGRLMAGLAAAATVDIVKLNRPIGY